MHRKEFYLSVMSGLILDIKKMISEIVFAFGNHLKLQTRLKIVHFFSKCLLKLFQIYKEESNTLKIRLGVTKTFNECSSNLEEMLYSTMKWWRNLFLIPSEDRDLLLHADIQVSLPKFMADLMVKINTNPQYEMEAREYYILTNLIVKLLESKPSKYLVLIASQKPEFICVLWFIRIFYHPELPFSKPRPFLPFNEMAKTVLQASFFKEKCFLKYQNFNHVSIKSDYFQPCIVEIWEKLYRLAFPDVPIDLCATFGFEIPKSAALPSKRGKKMQRLLNVINLGLNRFASGNMTLSHLDTIVLDFKELYRKDALKFYKLIFYSPHRFTIPLAFAAICYKNPFNQYLEMIVEGTSRNSNSGWFYERLLDLIIDAKNMMNDILFKSEVEISTQTKIEVANWFSKCFSKLFKLYKLRTNAFKCYEGNTKTFYEARGLNEEKFNIIVNWWKGLFRLSSKERGLLFHSDPQISLQRYINDLIKKVSPDYQLIYQEYCMMKILIAKVLESPPSKLFSFLAAQKQEFNCLFWFIKCILPQMPFTNSLTFPSFESMALQILDSKEFKRWCLIKYNKFNRMSIDLDLPLQPFALKIWNQMRQLAFPKTKSISPQEKTY
jgi:hypothetical protein